MTRKPNNVVRVEYICTGNTRSSICEMVARAHLTSIHPSIASRIQVSSSGTDILERVQWDNVDFNYCVYWLKRARGYNSRVGCFTNEQVRILESEIFAKEGEATVLFRADEGYKGYVRNIAKEAREKIEAAEAQQRDAYLRDMMLPIPGAPKQFVPDPALRYVLCIPTRHVKLVLEAYIDSADIPTIAVLVDFTEQHEAVRQALDNNPAPHTFRRDYEVLTMMSKASIDKIVAQLETVVKQEIGI